MRPCCSSPVNTSLPHSRCTVRTKVYKVFIEAVDAVDNGVNQWAGSEPPRCAAHALMVVSTTLEC